MRVKKKSLLVLLTALIGFLVCAVLIMTAIAMAGIAYHNTNKKRFLMAADTFLILITYIINLILLFQFSG